MEFVFNLSYLLTDWSLPLDHTCLTDLYFDTPLPENQQRDPTCRIITLNLFSLVQLHSPLLFYVPLSSAYIGSQQRGILLLSSQCSYEDLSAVSRKLRHPLLPIGHVEDECS